MIPFPFAGSQCAQAVLRYGIRALGCPTDAWPALAEAWLAQESSLQRALPFGQKSSGD